MIRGTFRKHERLRSRKLIAELLKKGKAVNVPPIRLIGMATVLPPECTAQVTFAVPKRFLARAVDRNRVRRLMREAYRGNKTDLYDKLRGREVQCLFLFVHQSREIPGFAEVQDKISSALDRWLRTHG